jgi:hypothetical protein
MEWRNEEFDLDRLELPAVSWRQRRTVAERTGVRV